MIFFPNAKINLGLQITEKRSDGFHNIETVFYPIPLCDILEFTEIKADKDEFVNLGLKIEGNFSDNLISKVINLLRKDFKIPSLKIAIYKKIPFGAGLGGGSSNASFMLKALNENFSLNISQNQLIEYAKQIGSDCAFFIENKPVFAKGKGDVFENITLKLKGYYLLLIKPDIHVNTALAYSGVNPQKPNFELKNIIQNPINTWKNIIINDFEKSIFEKFPKLENIKQTLYANGAIYASMSGSGSTICGIFDKNPEISKTFDDCFVSVLVSE